MRGAQLGREFFTQEPQLCARALIGAELAWGDCAGTIVETEAYEAVDDEACHTFRQAAIREFVARHPAGTAYVYLNYGLHWMVNVLVKGGAKEGFVLFRAVEPTRGLEAMRRRRGLEKLESLCSGPGKLTQAFGITGADDQRDLCAGEGPGFFSGNEPREVIADVRVGITRAADFPWRFLARDSRFVSVAAGSAKTTKFARKPPRPPR